MQPVLELIAEITLLPASESGKTTGYVSGVRPNHFFQNQESSVAGVIWFENQEVLKLGQSGLARVRFLYPTEFPSLLVGDTWRIQEGSRLVGKGKVLAITDHQG